MNRLNNKRLNNRLFTAMCLSVALLMGGCAQNELTDASGTDLPEGKYPLQISSVTISAESSSQPWGANAPQTRVAENTDGRSSVWNDGDLISVKLDGTTETARLKITNAATGTVTAQNTVYWTKTTDNVTAWYPENGTIDLADQADKLAYVLKASAEDAYCNSPLNLKFTHQLAKIRVELTGTADMEEGTVQVKGYTKGTISNGDVTGNVEDTGWITMQRISYSDGTVGYEANVIPGLALDKDAFQVTPKNGTETSLNLDKSVEVTGEQLHKITLTVNKAGTETIKLTEQTETTVYVSANASVIIDGGESELNKQIVINKGARVMLKNVNLKASGDVIKVNGTATLILSGTNTVESSSDGCPLAVTDNNTLTINGTTDGQLTLTGKNKNYGTLGLNSDANLIINGGHIIANGYGTDYAGIGSYFRGGESCGNITINGGKIEATGGISSAGIGAGAQRNCGNIIITGGKITAIAGRLGGAGIGSGSGSPVNPSVCGTITISGKNTYVEATASTYNTDDIGVGDEGQCGTVTITDATVIATNRKIHGL